MSKIERPTIKATLIKDVKLAEIENKAKAFDIIVNKNVDVGQIKLCLDYNEYNEFVDFVNEDDVIISDNLVDTDNKKITKDEFKIIIGAIG